jgi:predicted GNAT family acetyltransferase
MATLAKNFRIKSGLIVEGTTGTINGQNILTETGSDQYILDLVGGANLIDSVASGLSITDTVLSIDRTIVDTWYDAAGAAATAEGNANDYADGLASNYDPAGSASTAQTNAQNYADGLASNYDPAGSASTAESNAKSYADGLASNYDAAGSASQALTDANNYTDTAVSNLVGTAPAVLDTLQELAAAIGNDVNLVDGIGVAIGNKLPLAGGTMTGNIAMGSNLVTGLSAPSSDNDAARKKYVDDTAATAQTNAENYADGLAGNYEVSGAVSTHAGLTSTHGVSGDIVGTSDTQTLSNKTFSDSVTLTGTGDFTVNGNANIVLTPGSGNSVKWGSDILATQAYVDNQTTTDIAEGTNLYFTTTRAQDAIGTASGLSKQDQGTTIGIDRTTVDAWYDAAGAAATAEGNANDYADGLASNYDAAGAATTAQGNAESYADSLVGDLTDGTTAFTDLNINDEAKQIAASSSGVAATAGTAYEFPKATWRSGKFLVKIDNGTHNEISEILVTLDSSDNVAITEYAIVGTNGSRGTITADSSGSNVRIRVTPTNNSTIKITGTLLK